MNHQHYMQRCLQLAQLGAGLVAPNPMVGCVIAHQGVIIGEGYHEKVGEAHAEVNAINSVKNASLLSESTVYVSLEPCSHYGKTPPCANLLIQHNVKHVVVACLDPHEKVAGKGVQKLKDAGIEVTVGVLEKEATELNRRFFTFHQKKRPYVVLKWAETVDGFLDAERKSYEQTALKITRFTANIYTHQLRAEEQAILVGTETALLDNPTLSVRNYPGQNPIRIVLDKVLRLPAHLKMFTDGKPTLIINNLQTRTVESLRWVQPEDWNLQSILQTLHEKNINSVMVEGGSKLLSSFISEGIWDEAHQLKSTTIAAKSGPKAPVINLDPTLEKQLGEDQLTVYQYPLK